MTEPLHEEIKVSWLEFMKRFDQVIFPTIFEPRGYSRDTALVVWELSNLRSEVRALNTRLGEDAA